MARGNVEATQRRCAQCGKRVKAERNAMEWGCGDLVLVLFTLGIWAAIRVAFRPSWRCSECGAKV